MKRICVFVLAGLLLLSGCRSGSTANKPAASLTASQAAAAAETVEKTVQEAEIVINPEDLFVPEILVEEGKLEEPKISKISEESYMIGYFPWGYDFENNICNIGDYGIRQFFFQHMTQEEKAAAKSALAPEFRGYKKNGKEYFIKSEMMDGESYPTKPMAFVLVYYPDDMSSCVVMGQMEDVTEITDQLAEKIYDDFQCVTLKDLQQ